MLKFTDDRPRVIIIAYIAFGQMSLNRNNLYGFYIYRLDEK